MKRIIAVFVLLGGVCLAQRFPGAAATDADLLTAYNNSLAILPTGVDSVSTTITLSSSATFGNNSAITIDQEAIFCTKITANTCSGAIRGFDGTTPTTHAAGVLVRGFNIAKHHNGL